MPRGLPRFSLAGLVPLSVLAVPAMLLALPTSAYAFPPALPEGEPEPTPDAADTTTAGDASVSAGLEVEGDASLDGGAVLDPADDGAELIGSGGAEFDDESPFAQDADSQAAPVDDSDPGNVRGRREHVMLTNRGGAGLFHTSLPDAGGKMTFRFRLQTDFFRAKSFMVDNDEHARVRGGVAMSFSPAEWGELFFSVNSSANRNSREQRGRQDAEAIFALGDMDMGFKGLWRFKNKGIGVGGQVGLGLLSGSTRLLTSNINFWVDALFAVDVRYLTKKQFPFRFTTNLGWMLDNSLKLAPYGQIGDDFSREVTRFSLGGNHNRMRMKYAVDFPIRFGKERQFGIDPILEWAWDISTTEEPAFARENTVATRLPRSTQTLTVGARANVISGLHLDAAADIGLVSPNYEFGPRVPTWQIILGLGWSFDPNPVVKEVPVEAEAPPAAAPEPVLEGRVVGSVVDPNGTPIADAHIQFPGLATGEVATDANGNFTSYRFPAGQVAMTVTIKGEVVHEATAEVVDAQDTTVQLQLDTTPAPPTGVVRGTFTTDGGKALTVSVHVRGQGVDEAFEAAGGVLGLELDEGEYSGTVTAANYAAQTITFTVVADSEVQIQASLSLDKAPDTPNVIGGKRSIRLKKKIRYRGNAVAKSSHAILDELATFLQHHPEYAGVRVGVHTDDQGAAKRRSDERSESVKSYLVSKGISAGRLSTKGYGASKPVAVNLTSTGRSKNNRTVLTVTKKD